jgi:hypothetical protein
MFQLSFAYSALGHPYSNGLTDAQEIETLVRLSLAVICWSWVDGFVPGMLSGDTLFVLFLNHSLVLATAVWPRVLRISPMRKRSVSRARRWLDAFRLSMSCELIDGWARTRSMVASESCASRSSMEQKAEYFPAGSSSLSLIACLQLSAKPRRA